MQRVINAVDKSTVLVPKVPVAVKDSVSTTVFGGFRDQRGELSGIFIQNVGANDCYYTFGHDCDPSNFSGILSAPASKNSDGFGSGQQLDASNCAQHISVFSRGGTTIALTVLKRNDNAAGIQNILDPNP